MRKKTVMKSDLGAWWMSMAVKEPTRNFDALRLSSAQSTTMMLPSMKSNSRRLSDAESAETNPRGWHGLEATTPELEIS
jgi:hypothetical protein